MYCSYLAHYVWVVVSDEAEAPGPAGLLVVHHNRVFHLPESKEKRKKRSDKQEQGFSSIKFVVTLECPNLFLFLSIVFYKRKKKRCAPRAFLCLVLRQAKDEMSLYAGFRVKG